MKRFISGLLVTAMLFLCVGTAFATNEILRQDDTGLFNEETKELNLLKDGGFESGLINTENQWKFTGGANPWYSCGTASLNTDTVYDGNNSVYLYGGCVGQRITLESGKKYKMSVMLYPTVFYAGGVTMGFYDGTKEWPGSNPVKTTDVRIDWTNSWAEYSLIYECDKTQEYVVELYVDGGACETWADNFVVAETTEDEIINNPSIDVDYKVTNGEYNKDKLLNVSRGGYFVNRNRYWMPSYYDKYVEDGINMVRMDWILSDEYYHIVSKDDDGNFKYDFTYLDEVILPLLEKGITPYMCMTGTPEVMGGVIEPPWGFVGRKRDGVNLNELSAAVAAVVQHYKDLGYTGWYWESHNEPESGEWGSANQVAQQYGAFAKAVKSVDPTAKVGGIGFRNGDVNKDAGWKTAFFSYLQSNPDVPLDYISIHEYNCVTTFSSGDAYQNMAEKYGRENIPIIYSEYNYDWTVNSPGSVKDTNQNAAYISKRLFSALGQDNVDYVFYFTPSDAQNPTVLLNGDSGLYTINGHRKAAANTFNMLGDMENEMLSSDEDIKINKNNPVTGFATKNSKKERITFFAFNYTDNAQDFEFNITNLPYDDTNVKVTIKEISETSGNYAADYLGGMGGYSVTPNELPTEKTEVTENCTEYSKKITMPQYSVFEVILEPTDENIADEHINEKPQSDINLAFGKKVTASSEDNEGEINRTGVQTQLWNPSMLIDGQRLSLDMVNDGDTAMGYRSEKFDTADNNVWVSIDLGEAQAVNKVILTPENDIENDGMGFPVDFTIQTSQDNKNWTDVCRVTDYNNGKKVSGTQNFVFENTEARYVRINVQRLSQANDGYRLQLSEFEVIASKKNESNENISTIDGVYCIKNGDKINIYGLKNAKLYITEYENNVLSNVQIQSGTEFDLNKIENYSKIFIWTEDMRPICEPIVNRSE